ncbi:hypothetical protein GDO86_001465 [Hymenochirus boettgeri]|uniref:Centrosomal protein of 78 kDa n=1 Tax=Hymenochirus boettgeri TaxID=247094 RepID=A0A8T2KL42_9PIPI|nr:hypothetical protein GDO86_001465 [Hymenochirus boettgeri]
MTFQLSKAIANCLSISSSLKHLELHGLPLRERDLKMLNKGLASSSSVESLSIAYSSCGDEGMEIICQVVKNSPTIKTVNFTGCSLTCLGAEHIANIIKHQATRRHSEAWAESLRYRRPDLDCMTGLRRITLNCNNLIGDRGAIALAEVIGEDLWLKALDLRQCGISNEGAQAFLNAFQTNTTLIVLDIRRNPLIGMEQSRYIHFYYKWNSPPSSKVNSNIRQKFKSINNRNGRKGKNIVRLELYDPDPKPPGAEGFLPWRTAGRANRHDTAAEVSLDSETDTAAEVSLDSEVSESEGSDNSLHTINKEYKGPGSPEKISGRSYKRLQDELQEYQRMLHEERKARLQADDRIAELEIENIRLRQINHTLSESLHSRTVTSAVLEDEGVLDSIERSFNKFHAFLDLLKDAGLGQLASIAGLDQSDFALPGDPQMSSTIDKAAQQSQIQQQNLHGTFVIHQEPTEDKNVDNIVLSETQTSDVRPSGEAGEYCATSQKSKDVFDLDLNARDTNINSGSLSELGDAKCATPNPFDMKVLNKKCSGSDSSLSKKSIASQKSKGSANEKEKKRSSKENLFGPKRSSPESNTEKNQKASLTDASVSDSEKLDRIYTKASRNL